LADEISDVSLIGRLAGLPSFAKSRVVLRDPGQDFSNQGTQIVGGDRGWKLRGAPFNPKALFLRHYDAIHKALSWQQRQGVLVLAVDQRRVLGQVWLKATLDRSRAVIVGRHQMCDLALPDRHGDISLRHLAIMVRAVSHDEVRVRLLDLRSLIGFTDEAGRVLQAVSSEGSLFIRVGDITLMLLVTQHREQLPERAEDAYACIPERVFLDEQIGLAGQAAPKRLPIAPRAFEGSITAVRSQAGPMAFADELCGTSDVNVGALTVRSTSGSTRRRISVNALGRGLLVGRYDRCDIGLLSESASQLSRVHLLVVQDGDDILAIDTASSNGTSVGDREIRVHRLREGDKLDLAEELELVWHLAA